MNPHKRKKYERYELYQKNLEENVKKLEESLDSELKQLVVEQVSVEEETPTVQEQEVKISKKKKVV